MMMKIFLMELGLLFLSLEVTWKLLITGLYSGDFKHGLMDGTGSYVWPDGTNYVGTFKSNAISGGGVYEW